MNSLVILAVPVLMLLDYQLMILGAKASLGVCRQHFTPPFVVNPLWQRSIQHLHRFNPRHIIFVCFVTALLFLLTRGGNDPDLLVGMLLGAYGIIIGHNIQSLLLFRYLNGHPDEIEGHIHLTNKLVLNRSLFHTIGILPLVGLIAVLVPQPLVIGAFLGIVALALAHLVWVRKATSRDIRTLKSTDARPHSEDFNADVG